MEKVIFDHDYDSHVYLLVQRVRPEDDSSIRGHRLIKHSAFSSRLRVSEQALRKSRFFTALLDNGHMSESLFHRTPGCDLEIPLPEDDAESLLIMMAVLHRNIAEIPTCISLDSLHRIALQVDKHLYHEAFVDQGRKWIDTCMQDYPIDSTDKLLPWIWISYVFRHDAVFRKVTEMAQKDWRSRIGNTHTIPVPQRVIGAIETKRFNTISQVQSLLVALMEESMEDSASPFWMLNAFRVGFLQVLGRSWGLLTAHSDESERFQGVNFQELSANIKGMIDIDDWIVGTKPPGTYLPAMIDLMASTLPVFGRFVGTPGQFMYGTSRIKERFVELIEHLELGEWGLDLDSFVK